jgi:hypothetical protein
MLRVATACVVVSTSLLASAAVDALINRREELSGRYASSRAVSYGAFGRSNGLNWVCHALVFEQGARAPALAFVPPSQASGVLDEIAGEFHVGLLAKRFYMHVLPNTVARLIQSPSG